MRPPKPRIVPCRFMKTACFQADPSTRTVARRLYHAVSRPADRLAARPYRPVAGMRSTSRFRSGAAVRRARPLCVPHALQPGHPRSRSLGVPDRRRQRGRDRSARAIWRLFAAQLPSLPRHADAALARPYVRRRCSASTERLSAATADAAYDDGSTRFCARPDLPPRALYERFNIEVIATTESPLDDLRHHETIRASGWKGPRHHRLSAGSGRRSRFRRLPRQPRTLRRAYRLRHLDLGAAISTLHRKRRAFFKEYGATSTDHGHPDGAHAPTFAGRRPRSSIPPHLARSTARREDAELFRAQMLTEMAAMSLEDGHGDADPSRLVPQSQPPLVPPLRSRHGRRHPYADRLCARAETAARTASATSRRCP